VKRVRAAFVHATAQKFLADHSPSKDQSQQGQLRTAIAVLKPSVSAASRYISDLSASKSDSKEQQGSGSAPSQIDALADLFVDSQLLLLDCAEQLSASLTQQNGGEAEKERLQVLADSVLKQLGI
jgi:hypothetical protein